MGEILALLYSRSGKGFERYSVRDVGTSGQILGQIFRMFTVLVAKA